MKLCSPDIAYRETLRRLDGISRFGVKLGLERVERALARLGQPQRAYPSVHLAGSNGKGSTAAMIAGCLEAAGLRVGLYTSPHLSRFTERIRVAGAEISRREVARLAQRVLFVEPELTFFEVVTVMALAHFAEQGVQVAVVETGLGGRLDATNVLQPRVSVLTRIALDHTEILGDTLAEVAGEKAGIIKPGVPVVSAPAEDEVLATIQRRCEALEAPLRLMGRDFSASPSGGSESFDYAGPSSFTGLPRPLPGAHQLENAGLCLAALELLAATLPDLVLDPGDLGRGLGALDWPGRMERIGSHLLDGAHNPAGCWALAESLPSLPHAEAGYCLVLGVLGGAKDLAAMVTPLQARCGRICFTRPRSPRATPPEELARLVPGAEIFEDLGAALQALTAEREARPRLITGSLYLVGEAREILLGEPADPWPTSDPLSTVAGSGQKSA